MSLTFQDNLEISPEKTQTDQVVNQKPTSLLTLSQCLQTTQSTKQPQKIPPLHLWNPKYCGKMNLTIKDNGEWWHEGTKMTRQSLINLFSRVLWREEIDNQAVFFLKTPVEKLEITVEDAPLFINDVNLVQDHDGTHWIEFHTSTGDVGRLSADQPIYLRQYQGQMRPYIMVRHGLEGLVSRSVFYYLLKLGQLNERDGQAVLSLTSGDHQFELTVPMQD